VRRGGLEEMNRGRFGALTGGPPPGGGGWATAHPAPGGRARPRPTLRRLGRRGPKARGRASAGSRGWGKARGPRVERGSNWAVRQLGRPKTRGGGERGVVRRGPSFLFLFSYFSSNSLLKFMLHKFTQQSTKKIDASSGMMQQPKKIHL
jgi:hypothetical protein